MTDKRKIPSNAVTFAAVIVAAFTFMNVNTGLNALEDRVRALDHTVQELNQVESHIRTLQEDVNDIAELRNDILEAIAASADDADDRRAGRTRRPHRDRTP